MVPAIVAGALALAMGAPAARAESDAVCKRYAADAVAAQRHNLRRQGCGLRGDAWSDNYGGHYNWCRGQPAQTVSAEHKKRMDALAACTGLPAYCNRYANAAVTAQRVNASTRSCGKQGARWSADFRGHRDWCLRVGQDVAEREHQAREAEIKECSFRGAPKAPGSFAGTRVEGIELVRDAPAGSGTVPVIANTTFLSQASLYGRWAENRARLDGEINRIARGKRLYKGIAVHGNSRSQVTASCTARAEMAGGGIRVDIRLPGNVFFAQLTQPTVLGSYADPKFSVNYDVEATVFIRVPAAAGQAFGVTLTARVVNIRPDSQNFTGDVVKAVADLVDFFSRGAVSAMIPRELVFKREVETSLAPIARAIPAGYRLEQSATPGRPTMTLRATRQAPYYPPLR